MLDFEGYPYANWVITGIVIYMGVMLLVGGWSSKRVKNVSDFIVAGRRLPLWTYVGTLWKKTNQYGAVVSLIGGTISWVGFISYYLPATMEANVGAPLWDLHSAPRDRFSLYPEEGPSKTIFRRGWQADGG